jgi:hypothetical protein
LLAVVPLMPSDQEARRGRQATLRRDLCGQRRRQCLHPLIIYSFLH